MILRKNWFGIVILIVAAAVITVCCLFGLASCNAKHGKIIFSDSDGVIYSEQSFDGNLTITLPIYEKEGYVFEGWYFDDGTYAERLTEDTYLNTALTKTITVYGKWRKLEYITLSFDDCYTDEIKTMKIVKGDVPETVSGAYRDGYTFLGWYKDLEFKYPGYFTQPIYEDTTYYAKWLSAEPSTYYTVTLVNIPARELEPLHVLEGDVVSFPIDNLLTGYSLEGWFLEDTFDVLFDTQTLITSDLTLYAKWVEIVTYYTVTFDSNGGSAVSDMTEVPYNAIITEPTTKRDGYQLLGWCTDDLLTQFYDFSLPVQSDLDLVAKWEAVPEELPEVETFTITLVANGGDCPESTLVNKGELPSLPTPTKNNSEFVGWYNDPLLQNEYIPSAATSNITLYAKWKDSIRLDYLNLQLSSDESYYIITRYLSDEEDLVIPDAYNGKPIKVIGDSAFASRAIKTVTLPDSITELRSNAFANCLYLSKVYGGQEVVSIGAYAFSSTSITEYDFTDKVTYIGDYAFSSTKIKNVSIEHSVTFGNGVFKDCTDLVSVALNEATVMPYELFSGCMALAELSMPQCLEIGGYALYLARTLSSLNLPLCRSISDWGLASTIQLQELSIPLVEALGDGVFHSSGITSLDLPNVISIGTSAFTQTWRLTRLTIGSKLQSIASEQSAAFDLSPNIIFEVSDDNATYSSINGSLCSKDGTTLIALGNVNADGYGVIPSGVRNLSMFCFGQYDTLIRLSIPNTVTAITVATLSELTALTAVALEEGSSLLLIDGNLYTGDGKTLLRYMPNTDVSGFIIPNAVENIMMGAFAGCTSLVAVTLPQGMTTLPYGAFYNCSSIVTLLGMDSIETISDYAFMNSTTLREFSFPTTLSSIGDSAFSNSGLVSVVIPDHVTSLGARVFSGCANLQTVKIGDGITSLTSSTFSGCEALTILNLGKGITAISSLLLGVGSLSTVILNAEQVVSIDFSGSQVDFSAVDLIVPQSLLSSYVEQYGSLFKSITSLVV